MKPPIVLACVPDDEATRNRMAELAGEAVCRPYPNSTPSRCHRCGCKVWVGPTQQQTLALYPGVGILTYCLPCAGELSLAWGGANVVPLTDKHWSDNPPPHGDPS